MEQILSFSHLTDKAVVTELHRFVTSERRDATAAVALLAEFEGRRLHLPLGYTSAFDYCFRVLRLSEHEAYNRIEVARASREFPALLGKLADGSLSLTAIRLLAPHLTAENFETLTREAEGKRVEGIKLLIAKLNPQPAVPPVLMRHRVPSGDPAAIVEHALEVLHAQLLKEKAAIVAKPRTGKPAADAKGRYIPASIKRAVWRRDHGRCAFVAADGSKCGSTSGVEFHHVQPYAAGGEATPANIEMRCRSHNGFEWQQHLERETLTLAERLSGASEASAGCER